MVRIIDLGIGKPEGDETPDDRKGILEPDEKALVDSAKAYIEADRNIDAIRRKGNVRDIDKTDFFNAEREMETAVAEYLGIPIDRASKDSAYTQIENLYPAQWKTFWELRSRVINAADFVWPEEDRYAGRS